MQTINLDPDMALIDFRQARRLAVVQAVDKLSRPLLVAWKDDLSHLSAPCIPGSSKDRWRDYGSSHDGRLEINIGDEYHFIFSEADEYESPDLNVVTLTEQDGTHILCTRGACTEEERQLLGYFPGGGTGG